MKSVLVYASFDDFRSRHARLLEEASRAGAVQVALWSDATVQRLTGKAPRFPQEERRYLVSSIRYVSGVRIVDGEADAPPLPAGEAPAAWAYAAEEDSPTRRSFARSRGMECLAISADRLGTFPAGPVEILPPEAGRKKVVIGWVAIDQ